MSAETENDPYSKLDIILGASGVFQESFEFFSSFSEEKFSQKLETGWSIAENLEHLIKSSYLIPIALLLPKFIYIIFGWNKKKSRPYKKVIESYMQKVKAGAQASFVFSPSKTDLSEYKQPKMLQDWQNIGKSIQENIGKWSESDLDRYNMPHPILGMISVREMLFFTIFHIIHHTDKIKEKIEPTQM
ncbi:MAG: DinB family protein [Leptospiraceae bacterium]|nr:DinB family protein [Leptospiraceae bacterium]